MIWKSVLMEKLLDPDVCLWSDRLNTVSSLNFFFKIYLLDNAYTLNNPFLLKKREQITFKALPIFMRGNQMN
jgi:hypothetical protein